MINNIYLYVNSQKSNAKEAANALSDVLRKNGYIISSIINKDVDLVIGIGGDGTLINLLYENNYFANSHMLYLGINCGTVGFMQEFTLDDAINRIKELDNLNQTKVNLVSCKIIAKGVEYRYNAINEVYIIDKNMQTLRPIIAIDKEYLEDYVGTGLIFSTPFGSTGQNISSVGSIVHPSLDVLQMTPSEANIMRRFSSLSKSMLIPKNIKISLKPSCIQEVTILADRKRAFCGYYDEIVISLSKSNLKILQNPDISFISKIREKILN